MSSGKDGLPSAPLMDHEAVAMVPAPPSYEETMGLSGGYAPRPQYPPQPPYAPQQHQYPIGPHLSYPPQPYYGGPGFTPAQVPAESASSPPIPLHNVAHPPASLQYVSLGPTAVGPRPVTTVCPACRMNVKTTTVTENKTGAHVACVLLCLIGCCCLSCVPYCMDSCKKVRHSCPSCGNFMGTYTA
ncbi:lipopolysaccharide-induced tumor necrosis factor-alpha factor homolog [Bacillus rossius redtenbacheri]|uniref:lipopolysaccharide-induced tumor necrosis factor-alpha factor homolog n=1 Tax=Bacillus rossius redtenbacheri TaxID=93214 RepID=UPI002FDCAD56